MDILDAFENEPDPLDWIWPGFLASSVGSLVAPGSTGKSIWTMEAAFSVAASVAGGDVLELKPKHTGKVTYIAAEDDRAILRHRLHAMREWLEPAAREVISENLTLVPIVGKRWNLLDDDCLRFIKEEYEDSRLIVFDTLNRVHTGDENSNGDMSAVVSGLEWIAADGGPACLFLHHTPKQVSMNGMVDHQHAGRGATVLSDNPRMVSYVARMTAEEAQKLTTWPAQNPKPIPEEDRHRYVRFGTSKQNYGEPTEPRWYRRAEGGVLVPVELFPTEGDQKADTAQQYAAASGGRRHDW
ncbi:hypothetical protein BJI67_07330 [Acidihalobacter aeolianus]|uniref:Replication protein A n=1 Tax=Acidihalobacter aeolianus TaxID=2792603 RepID=A0A1D8KC19_9GAMM|nr:hypothetical protein BJI67_07330 [Acidihalobacter aeolianus]